MPNVAQLEMGRRLLKVRADFPARGPRASGWGAFLKQVGLTQATAWRYMHLASAVDNRGATSPPPPANDESSLPPVGGVYFVQAIDGGPIKIGESSNVRARLRALQTGSPLRLRLVAVAVIDEEAPIGERGRLESSIHARLSEHRLHGEWFEDCAEVRAVMTEVCR